MPDNDCRRGSPGLSLCVVVWLTNRGEGRRGAEEEE